MVPPSVTRAILSAQLVLAHHLEIMQGPLSSMDIQLGEPWPGSQETWVSSSDTIS